MSETIIMRFAYADPPYLGCGKKLYGDRHEQAADWDDPERHRQLRSKEDEERCAVIIADGEVVGAKTASDTDESSDMDDDSPEGNKD